MLINLLVFNQIKKGKKLLQISTNNDKKDQIYYSQFGQFMFILQT